MCPQLWGRLVIPCQVPLEVGAGLQEGEGELAEGKGDSQIPEALKSVFVLRVRTQIVPRLPVTAQLLHFLSRR